jgi:acyl-CoA oxidase
MFATTIREQASDEQRVYWMPKIEAWEIIGAYAQSEMGHGSNVRGLELEAKWDPKKGICPTQPDVNSEQMVERYPRSNCNPRSRSTYYSHFRQNNDAAQDPRLGILRPHPSSFRSGLEDASSLEGIAVGDIGPKYGYAPMDNAYMLFNKFR